MDAKNLSGAATRMIRQAEQRPKWRKRWAKHGKEAFMVNGRTVERTPAGCVGKYKQRPINQQFRCKDCGRLKTWGVKRQQVRTRSKKTDKDRCKKCGSTFFERVEP